MTQIIANYVSTTSGGANWYSVSTNKLTTELIEYFQNRAASKPDYCKINEDSVSWCTSFEWADQLALSTYISKTSGQMGLKCEPILTAEQRRVATAERKAQTTAPKAVAAAINNVDVSAEF